MEDSHSQPQVSGCSGAPLSEPPDIRNWFPGYKYETFVLDTCENFGFCVSNGTESCADEEENLGEFREPRKIDEISNAAGPDSSKILDSLQSQPLLSEPPDIRNWCSSYVYESPESHTGDGFTNYSFKENESWEDSQVNRDISKEKVEKCGGSPLVIDSCEVVVSQNGLTGGLVSCNGSSVGEEQQGNESLAKVMEFSQSPSLFSVSVSEPPVIRNWFPDYTSDCSVTAASDGIVGSLCEERKSEEDICSDGENSLEEGPIVATTKDATRLTVSDSVDKMEFEKYTRFIVEDTEERETMSKGTPFLRKTSEQDLNTKTLHGSEIDSNEAVCDDSSLNIKGLLNKPKYEFSRNSESESLETSINTRKCVGKSLEKLKSEVLTERSSQAEDVCLPSKHVPYHNATRGTPVQGTENKENEEIAGDGFIMTKKRKLLRKTDDENPWKQPEDTLLPCSRSKGGTKTECGNVESVKRKVLAERTNIQCAEAVGATGKWKCPQKSKAYRGPPMRQLRLEQWVHKL